MSDKYIGKPLRRREDLRFLTGRGRYVDDVEAARAAHAAFVRSPHAHARILRLSAEDAAAMPGVLAVLTGKDWAEAGLGTLPLISPVVSSDGRPMNEVLRPVLATDKVCHVGEPVAVVIARTRFEAADAAEAVEVDYEPLPTITETARALDDEAPLVHEQFGTNLVFDVQYGDPAAAKARFAEAAHVTELALLNNRVTANPMEPRCYLGHYDPADERYTLWSSTQVPHMLRRWLAEHSLRVPEHKIRVVSPDVGGGFGMKVTHYPEEPAVLWASKLVGRPVRWTSTRSEGFVSDAQARDHVTRCRMAFDADGRILAVEADTLACLGAYLSAFGASIPGHFYGTLLSGLYKIPAIACRVRGVYTNTVPVEAYRGAGRPEATYVLERLVENGARELGIDVCEIRARNLIQPDEFPYKTAVGVTYDSGNYPGLLKKLTALSDYKALREEQARLREQGVLMGIGMSAFIDIAGAPSREIARLGRRIGGWDSATVRVHPSAKVTVFCGGHSHGQGHQTAFSQIVADRLGCNIEDVEVVEGDTDRVAYGHGTWGSRSVPVIGNAILRATERVVEKGRRLAAHLLECAADDVVFEDGTYAVAGTDRHLSFSEVVRVAYHGSDYPEGLELGLDETAFYDPTHRNFPSAMHLCVVLVDPDSGRLTLRGYYAVDDVGRVINPMIFEGQVHGGVAQGIGQALMEDCIYEPGSGQLLSGSFMDYGMPRAVDLPAFRLDSQETTPVGNPLGARGGGESGTIGALAAVGNAVVDALWHKGVRHVDMPMTPMRVWRAMRAASG